MDWINRIKNWINPPTAKVERLPQFRFGYSRPQRFEFLLAARREGYTLHRVNGFNYCLKKDSKEFGSITFNFYWNSKSSWRFTVQTTLDHPKGRKQLNRKGLDLETCISLLSNPRKHTGKGYE